MTLGTLRTEDGKGLVRMEHRLAASIYDVWAALTDPARLAVWLGEIDGDLHRGGEYRARYFASGWEGTGRITVCEPPTHFRSDVNGGKSSVEVWLTADGDHTLIVNEERGMPVEQLSAYGAGIQIHIEDLAAYLVGREIDHTQAGARWEQLHPQYEAV